MNYIKGTSRDQLQLFSESLDNIIDKNNPVRVMDVYVESLDMAKEGFKLPELKTGTPPYNPQLLLKIYLYGYFEKIRSSRKLEKECKRNNELIWLTEALAPDFKTIANFRKDNRNGIDNVFNSFLNLCNKAGLLSLETVAIDGTKMRAQNSLNNIYNRDEMNKIQQKIQKKIEEYLSMLDVEDKEENLIISKAEVEKTIKRLNKLKKYQNKVDQIQNIFDLDKDLKTYFATDEDAKFQSDKGKVRAGYNPQIACDDNNKLILVNSVTNDSNDLKQMTPMVKKIEELKKNLNKKIETNVIMDAGYFSEAEILNNKDKELIKIIVSDKKESRKKNKKKGSVPAVGFDIDDFKYNEEKDIFVCPAGEELKKTHSNPGKERSGRKVFEYQCHTCNKCKIRSSCTKNKKGRSIKVSANKELMEVFKNSMKNAENKNFINKRKEIVEHPFGTIKRNLGYTYFMQTGIEKVKAEFSFICFTYNFKRVINILGVKVFIQEIERQKLLTS